MNAGVNANNNKSSYMSLYDEFALDYSYSGIQGGMRENLLKFNAHLEHTNSWFRSKDNMQTLSLDLDAELDNIEQTLFIIAANPYLAFDGEFYNLHLGLRVDAKTNSMSVGGIYPDIKGSNGCVIHPKTLIKNSVLASNVVVMEGAVIEDSIIMDSCVIGKNCRIKKTIMDRFNNIEAGSKIGLNHEEDIQNYYIDPSGIVVIPRGRTKFL